ncbi:MAG: lytic transglycosylase domain-containing protein [Nitrospirae bacterium]|nr:lytic transglycosylase domain-containing protein [Nitrospirota bacterium]MCL5977019.1 lytic transglycosylase domain-containing protein [Nitrospirota bacterium]
MKKSALISAALLLFCSSAHAFCFEEAAKAYGINQALIESIAMIESNLNPKAVNKNLNGSIDMGLMQINSFWVKTLGLNAGELISNPCYNTMTGAKILKQCVDRYGYTWEAVGCYNATSKHKRANYSWKIFKSLESRVKSQELGVKSPEGHNSKLQTQNSELFFSVRDKMSGHELSAIGHELKMESQ